MGPAGDEEGHLRDTRVFSGLQVERLTRTANLRIAGQRISLVFPGLGRASLVPQVVGKGTLAENLVDPFAVPAYSNVDERVGYAHFRLRI